MLLGLRSFSELARRFPLGLLAVEVVLIVVGVLLGIAVENRRQDSAERERAHEALELVAAELAENRSRIEGRLAYHRSVADSMEALSGRAMEGHPLSYEDLRRAAPNGFGPVLVSTTAWELARTADVLRHVDLEVMRAVSTAYEHQYFYLGKWIHLENNLYGAVNQSPQNYLGQSVSFSFLLGDAFFVGRALVEQTIPRALEAIAAAGIATPGGIATGSDRP